MVSAFGLLRLSCFAHEYDETGSPWGAGTFSGADGSRQPGKVELQIAEAHGKYFYGVVSKVNF